MALILYYSLLPFYIRNNIGNITFVLYAVVNSVKRINNRYYKN